MNLPDLQFSQIEAGYSRLVETPGPGDSGIRRTSTSPSLVPPCGRESARLQLLAPNSGANRPEVIVRKKELLSYIGFKADEHAPERALLAAGRDVRVAEIRSLLEQGAAINARSPHLWSNTLHKVFKGTRATDSEVNRKRVLDAVDLLIENGVDFREYDLSGKTPLMLARDAGWLDNAEMKEVFKKHGIDVESEIVRMDDGAAAAKARGGVEFAKRLSDGVSKYLV